MTSLAIGASVALTLGNNGFLEVATNGGLGSVTITPTGGASASESFGPSPFRKKYAGPYPEGASVLLSNSSAASMDYETDSTNLPASVQALVSAAGKFRRGSIRRFDALYGWYGAAVGGVSINKPSGLSSATWTQTVKMEVEAPFHAVRLMWRNIATNAMNNNTSVVGVTETNDNSTSGLMASPTIGGTTYQVVAGAGSINGWRASTYAGGSSVNLAAATTAQQYAISDETPLTSIARADGGSRPLLLYRNFHNGATDGSWAFIGSLNASLRTASAPMRNRTIAISQASSDAITTLTAGFALTTTGMECYPIVRHTVPALSVWGVGDSITQNSGLVADAVSSWGYRACLDASTPSNPVVYANFGASSQTAAVYLSNARAALAAGAPAPSVMVVNPCSVNDISSTPNARIVESMRYYAQETLRLARDYDIPVVVWWPLLPYNALNSAGDAFRTALNAEMQAIAAQCGVYWISFGGLGDGANPERWVPAMNYSSDGIHPNETAIDTLMAPALAGLLRSLAAQ